MRGVKAQIKYSSSYISEAEDLLLESTEFYHM